MKRINAKKIDQAILLEEFIIPWKAAHAQEAVRGSGMSTKRKLLIFGQLEALKQDSIMHARLLNKLKKISQ